MKKYLVLTLTLILHLALIIGFLLIFKKSTEQTIIQAFSNYNPVEDYFESGNIVIEVVE